MQKVLFTDNLSLMNDNPMSTCYILKCNMIKNDERFYFYNIGGNETIDPTLYSTVIFGCRSIYLYKCYRHIMEKKIYDRNIELCKIKNKFFIIQDMHPKTYKNIINLCTFLNTNHINIIFTFFNNAEAKLIKKYTPNVKHLHIPHHIDTSIFKFLNLEKKYDILLFGSIHPTHYPFRKRLFELINANKDKFNVHFIPKPETFNAELCEDGLAKLINMSKICIATKSKYDYLVGKYFEISLCKSLIAGDIPTDGIGIFKGRIIELNNTMTDQQIIDKLLSSLNNYDKFACKIDYLHDFTYKTFRLEIYPDKLYNLVNSNLSSLPIS